MDDKDRWQKAWDKEHDYLWVPGKRLASSSSMPSPAGWVGEPSYAQEKLANQAFSIPSTWVKSSDWGDPNSERSKRMDEIVYQMESILATRAGMDPVEAAAKQPKFQQGLASGSIPNELTRKAADILEKERLRQISPSTSNKM